MEASASQVVSSFPAADESAPPVNKQVHQEQIAADSGSFESTQQRTVENIAHVPIPQWFGESFFFYICCEGL